MDAADTLTGQLRRLAAARPDQDALVFVADTEEPSLNRSLTYAQLDAAARALAGRLRARHPAGDRMLLLYPSGPDFVVAFFACQYAELIAVPAPVPDGQQSRDRRLRSILRNSGSAAVLTVASAAPEVRSWTSATDVPDIPIVVTDEPAGETPWVPREHSDEVISFLQYTSGSTADPRGTVVTHRNLVAHAHILLRMFGVDGPVRVGGWVPMHHDMGLIGCMITPIFSGGTSVLMPSTAFLRRPVSWLLLVDRYDLDVTVGPNFAYELLTSRVTDDQLAGLDLSRLRVAVNGSEPVQARTVEAFTRRFAAAGLRAEAACPAYGLAEATLAVTMSPHDAAAMITPVDSEPFARREISAATSSSVRIVGCGRVTGPEVRIVDQATATTLPDRRIGEIWLRGPSVCPGYWANPAATAATFGAVTAEGEDGFLRTGDLGAMYDGELHVAGRIKETLIVHGRNLYPQDLEAEARTVDASLANLAGAAFTVPVPHEEVVVVHECRIRRMDDAEQAALADAIVRRLSREFGVAVNLLLTRPGSVPRTTSGKVQRGLVRERFLRGEIEPLVARLTARVRRTVQQPAPAVAR
ncbi:fatty acyl-AMP ligase [Actinoplanes sp. TBRC 11911]|uniref:fatty acyl-AMP ligase n=1 Tax=Actinoplanes sp. TBRC 11911 TaxID=2729386 RepID=UPI00145DFAA8|nr:fatty acyl-AMP ligase [Actinoplanes sp. TBRC 11911]NMO53354.1 fatty acyl-AMP ligase [Actinoplanes sp. TBRC 11911]